MKNEADEKSLTEITEADLIAMGIDAFFTRKKIMKCIKSTSGEDSVEMTAAGLSENVSKPFPTFFNEDLSF